MTRAPWLDGADHTPVGRSQESSPPNESKCLEVKIAEERRVTKNPGLSRCVCHLSSLTPSARLHLLEVKAVVDEDEAEEVRNHQNIRSDSSRTSAQAQTQTEHTFLSGPGWTSLVPSARGET